MSRKDYVATADLLNRELQANPGAEQVIVSIAKELARMFKQDNSRFDRQRFFDAVTKDTETSLIA